MPPKAGRPTKKTDEVTEKIMELTSLGMTDAEVSKIVGITDRTLCNWKKKHQGFFLALKEKKYLADQKVEDSLYHRAKGYSHTEEKIFCQDGEIIRAETTKHYPPDSTAMIYWLKNRRPDKWRERVEYVGDPQTLVQILNVKGDPKKFER